MRILKTFLREIMTQSKTALRAGTLLIILRGRNTRRSFIDFSCAPVGVPLKKVYLSNQTNPPLNIIKTLALNLDELEENNIPLVLTLYDA